MVLKARIGKYWNNLRGWRTSRKIIVIESDDWGSIRMPSKEIYNKCLKAGYQLDQTVYERYDSLLSAEDLELFFGLLKQYKDKKENNPIITANSVVANPDFERIQRDDYQSYSFELITDTFRRYPRHENNFGLWKKAMDEKLFFPQFHAREHLNVDLFMDALRKKDPDILFAFNLNIPGLPPKAGGLGGNRYIESTYFKTEEEKAGKLRNTLDGLDLFEKIFGYKSETITPTNYIWSPDFNKPVLLRGVKAFQGQKRIYEPIDGNGYRTHFPFLGQKNTLGQIHLVRNATFEPASMEKMGYNDPVDRCLSDIFIAFRMGKPAIICSHRVNYVGYIDEHNRDRSLKMLGRLLGKILLKWPEVEFMTSNNLANIILSEHESHGGYYWRNASI